MDHANEPEGLNISRLRRRQTRQLTTFEKQTQRKAIHIPAGEVVSLGEVTGHGYVTQLWLTLSGWFWREWAPDLPSGPSILKTLILRIYWDSADEPAVEAPVGDLFGMGLGEVVSFASQYFGVSSGGFFLRFPMPFRHGFRVEAENLDPTIEPAMFLNALYQLTEVPDDCGYFHAQFRTGEREGSAAVEVAEADGHGHYLGCTMSVQARQRQWLGYLESPEYIFLDGDEPEPTIVGTGMEDYFMGGWYFRDGPIVGPLHGIPIRDPFNSTVSMYRIHDNDAIHFNNSLRLEFVHPWAAEKVKPYRYSSVAYLYRDTPSGAGPKIPAREELLGWYRTHDHDHYHLG